MRSAAVILFASFAVMLMLVVPFSTVSADTTEGEEHWEQAHYAYRVTYNTATVGTEYQSQITGVYKDGNIAAGTAKETPISHDDKWNYNPGSWTWSSVTGLGPFNMFYAAISTGQEDDEAITTAKGRVAYILDPADLSKAVLGKNIRESTKLPDGTLGKYNIMLVIPTVYWYSDSAGNLYISDTKDNPNIPAGVRDQMKAYGHTAWVSASEPERVYPYLAIGVYEAYKDNTYGIMSKTGVKPDVSWRLSDYRSGLSGSNSGIQGTSTYQLMNYYEWTLYKILAQTVMQSKDVQKTVGDGPVGYARNTTGNGDASGPYSSSGTIIGTDAAFGKLFLENTWGSLHEWIDNAWSGNKKHLYVGNGLTAAAPGNTSGLHLIGDISTYHPGRNYISQHFVGSANWDIPLATNGTGASGDLMWGAGKTYTQKCNLLVGGAGHHDYSGLSTFHTSQPLNVGNSDIGFRLTYLMAADAVGNGVTYQAVSGETSGTVPVDPTEYIKGTSALVKGNTGDLQNPDPLKEFVGWEYNGKVYSPGEKIEMTGSDIVLRSSWAYPIVVLKFHGNHEDSGSMEPQKMAFNTPTQIKANAFVKEGYWCSGWYGTDDDGNEYEFGDSVPITVKASSPDHTLNIDLYVKWIGDFTLSYNVAGGSLPEPEPALYKPKQYIALAHYEGERKGYDFEGWSFEGKVYEAGGLFSMPYSDAQMTAVWKAKDKPVEEEDDDDIFRILDGMAQPQQEASKKIEWIAIAVGSAIVAVGSCLVLAVWRKRSS